MTALIGWGSFFCYLLLGGIIARLVTPWVARNEERRGHVSHYDLKPHNYIRFFSVLIGVLWPLSWVLFFVSDKRIERSSPRIMQKRIVELERELRIGGRR